MGRLEGKSIVITGAANGLGEAYARAVVAEGGAVVVNDIEEKPAQALVERLSGGGGKAVAHLGDVSSWDFAKGLIERCVTEFGRIDGLVNNAGILVMSPIEDQDEASFRRQVDINLYGQAFCGLHALRHMLAQGSGSVVNVYSGSHVGVPFRSAYAAATSGVAGMTASWAYETAGTGVRVNIIAPIALTRELEDSEPAVRKLVAAGRLNDAFLNLREAMTSLTTDMNAPMVVYLLSDAAAAISGQAMRFTGKELMLLTRPVVRSPVLTRDEWTVDEIANAFAKEWKDNLLPSGLAQFNMDLVRVLT